jgi:hypothetical protein
VSDLRDEVKWHVDLGSEPSFTVETLEVTIHRREGQHRERLYEHVPYEFLSCDQLSYIEVEGLEVKAPKTYQRVELQLVSGDMPLLCVTAWPDQENNEARTYFHAGMSVPARQGWDLYVSFDARQYLDVCPAHVRLRITKRSVSP